MSNMVVKNKQYLNCIDLKNVVYYILRVNDDNELKAFYLPKLLWGGSGINSLSPITAIHTFQRVKRIYKKEDGNQLHHMIITIFKKYNNPDLIRMQINDNKIWGRLIGDDISKLIFNIGYQNIFALHEDTNVLHIHFVINSINWMDGSRIKSTKYFYNSILDFLKSEYYLLNWEGIIYHD